MCSGTLCSQHNAFRERIEGDRKIIPQISLILKWQKKPGFQTSRAKRVQEGKRVKTRRI